MKPKSRLQIDPDFLEIDYTLITSGNRSFLEAMVSSDVIAYKPLDDTKAITTKHVLEHELDAYNLRNPQMLTHGNVETIYLGCSNTWGFGLPIDVTWTQILSEISNSKSYINLAYPGASIHAQMQSLFGYIKKYGKPKRIIAYFPNLTRLRLPVIGNKLTAKSEPGDYVLIQDFVRKSNQDVARYSKRPHEIADVLPADFFYYLNIQAINIIDSYAQSHEIDFVWSTWDEYSKHFLEALDQDSDLSGILKNYVSVERQIISECKDQKHLVYKSIYPSLYDIAEDNRHIGIHDSLHIAEMFYKKLDNKQNAD